METTVRVLAAIEDFDFVLIQNYVSICAKDEMNGEDRFSKET